jgi:peroxiredoxin
MRHKKNSEAAATPQRKKSGLLGFFRDLLLIILVIIGVKFFLERDLASGTAADFAIFQSGQAPVTFTEYRDNQAIVLWFWGTWCGICQQEVKAFQRLAPTIPILGLAWDDNETLANFLKENSLPFQNFADENGQIARKYGVNAVPVIFIINAQGEIVFRHRGWFLLESLPWLFHLLT